MIRKKEGEDYCCTTACLKSPFSAFSINVGYLRLHVKVSSKPHEIFESRKNVTRAIQWLQERLEPTVMWQPGLHPHPVLFATFHWGGFLWLLRDHLLQVRRQGLAYEAMTYEYLYFELPYLADRRIEKALVHSGFFEITDSDWALIPSGHCQPSDYFSFNSEQPEPLQTLLIQFFARNTSFHDDTQFALLRQEIPTSTSQKIESKIERYKRWQI